MVSLLVNAMIKAAFIFGLFILPFVFWPKAFVPYEIPRVWFLTRWVELLIWFFLSLSHLLYLGSRF